MTRPCEGTFVPAVAPTGTNRFTFILSGGSARYKCASFPWYKHAAPLVLRPHAGMQLHYSPPTRGLSPSSLSFTLILISILFSHISFSSHTSISHDPVGAGASQRHGCGISRRSSQRPARGPPSGQRRGQRGCVAAAQARFL
jgi:hypothetical protein